MPEYTTKEKTTFKDIVYQTISDIEKKAIVEFKGGQKKTVIHGNWSETTLEPDSRKEYIQSIEFLYDLLYPTIKRKEDYPPKFREHFKTINQDCDGIMSEIDKLLSDFESKKINKDDFVIKKTRLMRKLFRILVFSLNVTNVLSKGGGGVG